LDGFVRFGVGEFGKLRLFVLSDCSEALPKFVCFVGLCFRHYSFISSGVSVWIIAIECVLLAVLFSLITGELVPLWGWNVGIGVVGITGDFFAREQDGVAVGSCCVLDLRGAVFGGFLLRVGVDERKASGGLCVGGVFYSFFQTLEASREE